MNPKYLNVRVDRHTGDLWLTDERRGKPLRKIANITAPVPLALSAELTSVDNSTELSRDVKFSDGSAIRVSVTLIEENANDDRTAAPADPA